MMTKFIVVTLVRLGIINATLQAVKGWLNDKDWSALQQALVQLVGLTREMSQLNHFNQHLNIYSAPSIVLWAQGILKKNKIKFSLHGNQYN